VKNEPASIHLAAVPEVRNAATTNLAVVVPAYNEAATLPALLRQLQSVLACMGLVWQVIVVDDGSSDHTAQTLRGLMHEYPGRLRLLRLSRNFGKEAALSAGLARATADVVVMMDADGQHPPALIPAMLQAWYEGADMVCAVRNDRSREAWFKRWGTRCFYALINAGGGVPIPKDAGDFRLLDRRVVEALNALPERNRFMKGLYAWVGFETRYLPYAPETRWHGQSRYSMRGLIRLAFTGLTAFSTLPLRLSSALGSLIALGALLYGTTTVAAVLWRGHELPGWPTLVAGMMFLGGVQLLSIGVLGEYVGRVFDEVKQRPLYVVSEDLFDTDEALRAAGRDAGVTPTTHTATDRMRSP
jgi:polyisoprenyl-phosphate glycosyltransferase